MSLTRAQAAQMLGMKEREVVAVDRLDDGHVITTHDGVKTFADAAGMLFAYAGHPKGSALPDYEAPARAKEVGEFEDPDAVPDTSADKVLAWVGDDPDRAARAIEAEKTKDRPRSTLIAALEKVSG